MPTWSEEEGIYVLTELEEQQQRHKGNVLTPEQRAKGRANGGHWRKLTPEEYSRINRARVMKRWAKAKEKGTEVP